jgi:concanavalin A-like lectin/glucanase superfamily protein/parallel beta helix pectate lyase-like protein/putative Ig domain-containing protein
MNLSAATRHVAPNGSSSGDGSINDPWSIVYAATNAQAGDLVYVRGGTYMVTSVIYFETQGTADNPVVFRNYPGETPVFDGNFSTNEIFKLSSWPICQYTILDGLEVKHSTNFGIRLMSGESNIVMNCKIHDCYDDTVWPTPCSGSGIQIYGGSEHIVRNNEIYNIGWNAICNAYNENCLVEANKIYSPGHNGVDMKPANSSITECQENIDVINNNIYDCGNNGIFFRYQTGNIVAFNLVNNVKLPFGANPHNDDYNGTPWNTTTLVANNTFSDYMEIYLNNVYDTVFVNNILDNADNSINDLHFIFYENTTRYTNYDEDFYISDYNLFHNSSTIQGRNTCISGDPTFVNSASRNFFLQSSSPALGTGKHNGNIGALAEEGLSITTTDLPPASAGNFYRFTVKTVNGLPLYNFTISDGELPDGLYLSKDGTIYGWLATGAESRSFTIKVTDDASHIAKQELKIRINSSGPTESLVCSLSFDQSAGSVVLDESGRENDCIINQGNIGSGIAGNSLSLANYGDWAEIKASDSLKLTTAGTVEFWYKYSEFPWGSATIFGNGAGWPQNAGESIIIWCNPSDSKIYFGIGEDGTSTYNQVGISSTANVWHHYALTFDLTAGELKVYLDGELANQTSTTISQLEQSIADFKMSANTRMLYGPLDNLKIYKVALNEATIKEHAKPIALSVGMDEISGGIVLDGSCNNQSLTKYGTASIATCTGRNNQGTALTFARDWNTYVQADTLENMRSENYTVSVWLKPNGSGTTNRRVLRQDDDGNGWAMYLWDNNNIYFIQHTVDDSFIKIQTPFPHDGSYHHVVAVCYYNDSSTTVKLYIDGDEKTSVSRTSAPKLSTAEGRLRIGADYYEGAVDCLKLIPRALSQDEISELLDD